MIDVLRAYVDATGDYKDDACKAYGVVGIMGRVEDWHRIQAKWEDALDCCGVTRFHGTDLQAFEGDYEGWTAFQRDRLVSLLVGVVQENMAKLRLIGATTVMADYRRLPKYRKQSTRNPYYLGAVWTMAQATWKAQEDFGGLPVEIIFDQQHKQKQLLDDAWDEVKKTSCGHLLVAIGRADHRLVSPVQIADLAAYESKKFFDAKYIGKSRGELRWPLEQLRELFFGSRAALFDQNGLMLATDYWGNYERAQELIPPNWKKQRIRPDPI